MFESQPGTLGAGGGGSSLSYGNMENGEVLRAIVHYQCRFTQIKINLCKNKFNSFASFIVVTFTLSQGSDILQVHSVQVVFPF